MEEKKKGRERQTEYKEIRKNISVEVTETDK